MEPERSDQKSVPELVDAPAVVVEKYPNCPRIPLERQAFERDYKDVLDDPDVVQFRGMMKHLMDNLDMRTYRKSGLAIDEHLDTGILNAHQNERQQYIFPFKKTSKWNNITTACAMFDNMHVELVMVVAPDAAAKHTNMGYSPRTDYASVLKTAKTFDLIFTIRRFNTAVAYNEFADLLNDNTTQLPFRIVELPEKIAHSDDDAPPDDNSPEDAGDKKGGSCAIF